MVELSLIALVVGDIIFTHREKCSWLIKDIIMTSYNFNKEIFNK